MPLYVLEEKAGISKESISKWDIIDPSFDKVCRVAKILGIEVNKLISWGEDVLQGREKVIAAKERSGEYVTDV